MVSMGAMSHDLRHFINAGPGRRLRGGGGVKVGSLQPTPPRYDYRADWMRQGLVVPRSTPYPG